MDGTRCDPVADAGHALVIGMQAPVGAAVARRVRRAGCRVTLVDRDEACLREIAASLPDGAGPARLLTADAGDPYALRAVLAPVCDVDPPGIVVYNAARADSEAEADAVNVVGAIVAAQLVSPAMRAAGAGTIIITGAGPEPEPGTLALGERTLRAVATILAGQLDAVGVHVAHVTIAAVLDADGPLTPEAVGDACWEIHTAAPDARRTEYRLPAA